MGLNRVAVVDVSRTMTQGSSCLATLGSGTESRWDSRTERDSASRSRFANTEMVGCFRRNIACGSTAGRRHVERWKSKDPKVPIGTTESSPRFQPWVAIGEWPEPRRGDRKDGTGPVRSFVPDGTRFMFAPQPSDKSRGYFRASLRDVESRHAKHVQSYPHAVAPRLVHRSGDLRLPEHMPAGGPHRYRICRRRHRTRRASTRRTPPATFLPGHCHRWPRGSPQTQVRTTPHLVGRC